MVCAKLKCCCSKTGCVKMLLRTSCILLILMQASIVMKILICMIFPCPLIEQHIFHGIQLVLHLFENYFENGQTSIEEASNKNLLCFYIYLVAINVVTSIFFGIISSSTSLNDEAKSTQCMEMLCFLGFLLGVCFVNLLHSGTLFVLVIYIGVDGSVIIDVEAIFMSIYILLQIVTFCLLLSAFNYRYQEIQKEKSFLHTATLIHKSSSENGTPLLIR